MKLVGKLLFVPILLGAFFVLTSANSDNKETERIKKSIAVVKDFSEMKESIPSTLLEQAQGIVIIPKMINAGLGIGGKRGRGIAMVKLSSGEWSNPVFMTITGGSIGFQAGVQAVDLVLLFKHKESLTDAKKSEFTIGGDLSVAAGPVGRNTSANTDYKLEAEVYSYSRSKGLFAGVSVNGSNLAFDKTAIANFYGSDVSTSYLFKSASETSTDIKSLRSILAEMEK
ncbi:lipid-binding SYLF domain-containing protein [Olivibacter domesticus]|uniref:Lipid-binding SYLF domain-containing protein n=1 Tax=Olivibacter domesticus TaxID=407022 RepID=A0A1H7Q0I4_OLID1|nr:lipid-binding SYLF domain-containing protein [Olivibacter domesticus]SEL41522.1 Lipid-binding SYLF domain-containing protein [Olivibacter domesticus]